MTALLSFLGTVVDSIFRIVGNLDPSKGMTFQVDTQATASTFNFDVGAQTASRVATMPVLTANATYGVLGETQTFSGAKTFSAVTTVSNATNATSPTTGGLVVTGGLGVGSDIVTAGNELLGLDFALPTSQRFFITGARTTHFIRYSASGTASGFGSALAAGPGGDGVQFDSNFFAFTVANSIKVQFDVTGAIKTNSTTASTNSTTGSILAGGGVGVAGDLNVAGNIGIGTVGSTSGVLINAQGANLTNALFRVTSIGASTGAFMQLASPGGTVEYNTDTNGNWLINHAGVVAGVLQSVRSGAVSGTLSLNAGAAIVRTDPGGTDVLRVGGGVTINDTKIMTTKTAFTNGAGASLGTLTNAPAAGNPTKWISINDNGTTRQIPAW